MASAMQSTQLSRPRSVVKFVGVYITLVLMGMLAIGYALSGSGSYISSALKQIPAREDLIQVGLQLVLAILIVGGLTRWLVPELRRPRDMHETHRGTVFGLALLGIVCAVLYGTALVFGYNLLENPFGNRLFHASFMVLWLLVAPVMFYLVLCAQRSTIDKLFVTWHWPGFLVHTSDPAHIAAKAAAKQAKKLEQQEVQGMAIIESDEDEMPYQPVRSGRESAFAGPARPVPSAPQRPRDVSPE